MRIAFKLHFLLILLIILPIVTSAQVKDSSFIGTASGTIKDSGYNYMLQFATVAIYKNDSNLVKYQLTEVTGDFSIKGLPLDIPLHLRAFYTGYRIKDLLFTISSKTKAFKFEAINLVRDESQLEDVIVKTIVPVRMNGDTLEFNANAFKLDKNAVGEDLLRQLPGVTVWADGSITVNGKLVSKVLVDGRPFFGNDPRIALQNISKNAIDRVQVYQLNTDINNPFDSTSQINIKLKKGQNFGFFGKVGVGAGSNDRYTIDGNINFFNPRTQIGFGGMSNNINKVATDVNTLLKNSTFKGSVAGIEYQTDFGLLGTNQATSAGAIFQHDFLPKIHPVKKEILSGNYFFKANENNTIKEFTTTTSLNSNSLQILNTHSNALSANSPHRLNVAYEKKGSNTQFEIKTNAESVKNKSNMIQKNSIADQLQIIQSRNNDSSSIMENLNKISLEGRFIKTKSPFSSTRVPGDFEITFSTNYGDFNKEQISKTDFTTLQNSSQNKKFDRKYLSSGSNSKHELFTNIGDLSKWIFGYKNSIMSGIDIKLQNLIEVTNQNDIINVSDFDPLLNKYIVNKSLTANNQYNIVNENPGVNISKKIIRSFAARYQKSIFLSL